MSKRITAIAVMSFVLIIVLFTNPKLKEISREISPEPPKIMEIQIYFGDRELEDWDLIIQDRFLNKCSWGFTYTYNSQARVLNVYILDEQTILKISENKTAPPCTSTRTVEGTLVAKFLGKPDFVTITIWTGKSSKSDIYFESLGTWRFQNGKLLQKTEPFEEQDYALMSLNELKKIIEQNGVHQIIS